MNNEAEVNDIKKFVHGYIREVLLATKGKNPDLSLVIVWVESVNPVSNMVTLGFALGAATGCSPFCGCAAADIAKFVQKALKQEFPWIRSVVGKAAIPSPEVLKDWQKL